MKLRNLMLLVSLAPVAQPLVAKPMVTYTPDAVAQISGASLNQTQQENKKQKGKKGDDKKTHKEEKK